MVGREMIPQTYKYSVVIIIAVGFTYIISFNPQMNSALSSLFHGWKKLLRVCWIILLSIVLTMFPITSFPSLSWRQPREEIVQGLMGQKQSETGAIALWRISESDLVTKRNRNAQQILAYSSYLSFHIQLFFPNANSADQQWLNLPTASCWPADSQR